MSFKCKYPEICKYICLLPIVNNLVQLSFFLREIWDMWEVKLEMFGKNAKGQRLPGRTGKHTGPLP